MIKHSSNLRIGRYSQENNIYFVTTNSFERQALFHDFSNARIVIENLKYSDEKGITTTIGYTLMPDHLHWLFRLNYLADLSQAIGRIKGRSAKQINARRKEIRTVWQPGFYDHCLRQDEEIKEVMRYIVANPLRAKIVQHLKDYPHWDCIYL